MGQVGSVQGDGVDAAAGGQCGPERKAEMSVHDIEPATVTQRRRRPRVSRRGAGLERVHLDLHLARPLQRSDLITHEAALRRPLRRGVHVGDYQRAH